MTLVQKNLNKKVDLLGRYHLPGSLPYKDGGRRRGKELLCHSWGIRRREIR
jgi:hypothetical protein